MKKAEKNKGLKRQGLKTLTGTMAFLAILTLAPVFSAFSQPVGKDKATQIARNFYNAELSHNNTLKSAENLSFRISQKVLINENSELKSANTKPAYYVVSVGDDEGFILVAGDERAKPILGYSLNGNYSEEEMPEHIASYFNSFRNEISEVVLKDIKTTKNPRWNELENGYTKSGGVSEKFNLIATQWGQGKYYNDMCPEDPAMTSASYNGHVPAGCVATVMAQILNYWSWPEKGEGSNCYTPSSHNEYGEQCADFEASNYNFESIPAKASNHNDDISKLIYHAAVSVKMNFTPAGSQAYSSFAAKAFTKFFRFSEDAEFVYRSDFTDEEWISLLKSHLDNGIPLYYRGDNDGWSAHAFILDGYDNEGRFHFNWGWDGRYDGFFELSSLEPMGNYKYNTNQGAIINLIPLNNDFLVNDLTTDKKEVVTGETISISYEKGYNGASINGLAAKYSCWLSSDEIIGENDILIGEDVTVLSASDNSASAVKDFTISENIAPGKYFLLVSTTPVDDVEDINPGNNQQSLQITIDDEVKKSNNESFACSDQLEPNNDEFEAFFLGEKAGYFNDGLCLSQGDNDWFEFTLNSETYFVQIAMADPSASGYYGVEFSFNGEGVEINTFETNGISDTKIWLYDSQLQLIAEDDNGGEDPFARLLYLPSSSTTGATAFSNNNMKVYPNPAKSRIYISTGLNTDEDVTVTLQDIRGTLLEKRTFDNNSFTKEYSLDMTPYADGQYIVKIYWADGACMTKKVMKNSWI